MARSLPPLNALQAFEAAARHRHLRRAARELGVTHGAVSRQLRKLEDHLGCRLFERTGRGLELTEAGLELADYTSRAFDELAFAADRLSRHPSPSTLLVSAPRGFTSRWLAPRLGHFVECHPWIALRLDSSADEAQMLGRGEADVSVSFGNGSWAGLTAELIGPERLFPVCAPSLLHGPRPLQRVADLARHVLLHFADFPDWPRWLAAHGEGCVDATRGPRLGEMSAVLAAAEAGQGVAIGRSSLVGRELRNGRLVKPFAGDASDGLGYYLLSTPRGVRRPNVAAFRAWVLRQREPVECAPGAASTS